MALFNIKKKIYETEIKLNKKIAEHNKKVADERIALDKLKAEAYNAKSEGLTQAEKDVLERLKKEKEEKRKAHIETMKRIFSGLKSDATIVSHYVLGTPSYRRHRRRRSSY